jgi:RNA polymerase sigma factor (TIGR02999 family)
MEKAVPDNLTLLLEGYSKGDKLALEKILPVVYSELHRISSSYLRKEYKNITLQTTELVHEAYIKLFGNQNLSWQNRAHFFAIAANSMRQILVDYARKKIAQKRGGDFTRVSLFEGIILLDGSDEKIIALDEALKKLSEFDPQLSQIVELRFFSGLSIEETSNVLNVSESTIKREWNVAKAWLYREINQN